MSRRCRGRSLFACVTTRARTAWPCTTIEHEVRSPGPLSLRNLYFEPAYCIDLPGACRVVTVSPLLRELILYAVAFDSLYDEAGAAGRLMRVIVDQIRTLPVAPLHLPLPDEPRLRTITLAPQGDPADNQSLDEWGRAWGRVHARWRGRWPP